MSKLSNMGYLRELLERHGFRFSKGLGQNFIVNPSVCPRMAELSGARAGVGVLEIGPGVGVLTAELAQRADKVVCIEIDERLPPILAETLAEYDNVTIVQGDVLKVDLPAILQEQFGDMPVVVCANLPYYITSPILMHLLESRLPVEAITVMVQKEAAVRICARPGTRETGAVSVAVQYYSEPKMLFTVSRGSFMPAPDVDSAVLRLDIRPQPPVEVQEEAFFRMVRGAFGQRRKTLLNALSSALPYGKETIAAAMQAAGTPAAARAEQLTMEQFGALSRELENR